MVPSSPVASLTAAIQVADVVRFIVAEFSGGAGQMVDGNAFAATLLRPTINGVVVPTLSIALGTLLATTVNVLRDRQVRFVASQRVEAPAPPALAFTRYSFYFEAFVHESTILTCPPPTCIAHPSAILLHEDWTV